MVIMNMFIIHDVKDVKDVKDVVLHIQVSFKIICRMEKVLNLMGVDRLIKLNNIIIDFTDFCMSVNLPMINIVVKGHIYINIIIQNNSLWIVNVTIEMQNYGYKIIYIVASTNKISIHLIINIKVNLKMALETVLVIQNSMEVVTKVILKMTYNLVKVNIFIVMEHNIKAMLQMVNLVETVN